jgi:hypothetical protein
MSRGGGKVVQPLFYIDLKPFEGGTYTLGQLESGDNSLESGILYAYDLSCTIAEKRQALNKAEIK